MFLFGFPATDGPVVLTLSNHGIFIFSTYRIAKNFGRKNIWWIALIMTFGGFYFGGWVSLMP